MPLTLNHTRFRMTGVTSTLFRFGILLVGAFLLGIVDVCSGASENRIESLVAQGARPERLASGFGFTEGPAADADGNVYFSDIAKNRIHRWNVATRSLVTIREDSGGADGLYVNREGQVLICELKARRLSKLDPDGTYGVIADSYEGGLFTGPNDLWIDAYGGIYFSDSYGGSQRRGKDHRVFYLSSEQELRLVADDFYKSNGLLGTPDGKWLYIADYIENRVYRFELLEPGVLGEREVFAEYRCDGMTLDEQGNLYLCTGNAGHGIVVMNPSGIEIGKIEFPRNPANVCFGGENYSTLFVTAQDGFFSLAMQVRGNRSMSPEKPLFVDEGGLADLVVENSEPRQLASGFRIAQGPACDAKGDVYFSDIYHHRIMKWECGREALTVVRDQPGAPDGLFVEADGSLLVCELTGRRFARLHVEGRYEIIADSFQGEPLTGPNDVYVDRDGGIYFSDSYPGSQIREPVHCVYYVAPGERRLKRLVADHYKTKGIHESPDRQWLYIADYGGRKVYRYRLISPGEIGEKELFVDTRCGGLTVDERGNVYLSTVDDRQGVLVFAPDGGRIGQIHFPEPTTNVVFAGSQRDQLFVTTFKSLYSLPMKVRGSVGMASKQ